MLVLKGVIHSWNWGFGLCRRDVMLTSGRITSKIDRQYVNLEI